MKLSGRRIIFAGSASVAILFIITGNYVWDFNLMNGNIFGQNDDTKTNIFKYESPFDITIVTMYLNIGKFQKGHGKDHFTPNTYTNWMKSWGMLTNRVIGFFDDNSTLEYFRQVRSLQPEDRTVLIRINRTDLPAFKGVDKIRWIYQQPYYPRHPPNTVVPEYSCAMFAKYDALQMAMSKGLVNTKYIAWLDIGLFRHLVNTKVPYTLEVPDNFNSSCVSMSEVTPRGRVSKVTPWDFIKKNIVWVAGGYILGTPEKVLTYSKSFQSTVNALLQQNMSSTDQQVIGAMFSPSYIRQQEVDLRPYGCYNGQFNLYSFDAAYFCLAYVCKDAAEKRHQTNSTTTLKTAQRP